MKILAYTISYGERTNLQKTIPDMRGTAGVWFDWLVCLGAPSDELSKIAHQALNHPHKRGIQHLIEWPQNRGQHHATKAALALARKEGYDWLLRIDDDLVPKTKRWLKKLIDYTEKLNAVAGVDRMNIISAPKIMGLRNPLSPIGHIALEGLDFKAEAMDTLGGACRLHPVELMKDFEPQLYAPLGRRDPDMISEYAAENEAVLIRFPGIRMVHKTEILEAQDSEEQAYKRKMGHFWPYLGPTEESA